MNIGGCVCGHWNCRWCSPNFTTPPAYRESVQYYPATKIEYNYRTDPELLIKISLLESKIEMLEKKIKASNLEQEIFPDTFLYNKDCACCINNADKFQKSGKE